MVLLAIKRTLSLALPLPQSLFLSRECVGEFYILKKKKKKETETAPFRYTTETRDDEQNSAGLEFRKVLWNE